MSKKKATFKTLPCGHGSFGAGAAIGVCPLCTEERLGGRISALAQDVGAAHARLDKAAEAIEAQQNLLEEQTGRLAEEIATRGAAECANNVLRRDLAERDAEISRLKAELLTSEAGRARAEGKAAENGPEHCAELLERLDLAVHQIAEVRAERDTARTDLAKRTEQDRASRAERDEWKARYWGLVDERDLLKRRSNAATVVLGTQCPAWCEGLKQAVAILSGKVDVP